MELSLHRLRMLHEFARYGTITGAATALHYTSSAVSQQLSALEREVGLELLQQVGRKLRLTEMGRLLAKHAAEILAAEERARIALEQGQETLTADLTVGVLATIAASLVPPALGILAQRHPGVTIRTREVTPEDALAAVRDGGLDLAFVLDYPDAPTSWDLSLEFTVVSTEALHLVVPRGKFDLASPVELADLAEYPWIASGSDTDFGRALLAVCRLAGFEPHIPHQVDEQSTAMAMVAGKLGITLVADLGLTPRPGGIDILRLRQPIQRRVILVGRKATSHRPSEQAFVRCAVDAAAALGLHPSEAM